MPRTVVVDELMPPAPTLVGHGAASGPLLLCRATTPGPGIERPAGRQAVVIEPTPRHARVRCAAVSRPILLHRPTATARCRVPVPVSVSASVEQGRIVGGELMPSNLARVRRVPVSGSVLAICPMATPRA